MDCTVIIPAYNAEAFIEQAVRSARAQCPEHPVRVIVVDDGSKDGTAARVEAIAGAELVRQANAGVSAARNAGLALAESEFVVFLDADDELLEGALAAHAEVFKAHSGAVMVYGSNHVIDENGKRLGSNTPTPFETRDFMRVACHVTPCPSQVMLRREAVISAGGFDRALKGAEDADLWLRLLQYGSIVCHPAVVMNYRKHSSQATRRPSLLFAHHKAMIERRLRDPLAPKDAGSIRKLKRKWQEHYGQFIPAEIVRLALHGKLGEALSAGAMFVTALPASGTGALRFVRKRLGPAQ